MGVSFEVLKTLEKKIIGILGCKNDQDKTDFNSLKQSFKKFVTEIVKTNIQNIQSQVVQNKLPNTEIEQLVQIITGFLEFDRQQRLSLD